MGKFSNNQGCLVTCFLLNDEMCHVLNEFNKELMAIGYQLVVLSSFTPRIKSNFRIHAVPYSFYEYSEKYMFHAESDETEGNKVEEIVRRDMEFSGSICGSIEDHRRGFFICEHIFTNIIEILNPSFVMLWGSTLPQSSVQKRVCERHGIPVFIFERGLLADTLMVEAQGHGAESRLNTEPEWWRKWQLDCDVLLLEKAKEYYLEKRPQKYLQTDYSESVKIIDNLGLEDKKIIIFWGQHDTWSGLLPRSDSISRTNSPFFSSTADALIQVAEAVSKIPDAVLIFKPHPRDKHDYHQIKNMNVILIRDIDNHSLFVKAHCIMAMLTTTQFEALFYEKPIILLAESQLKGKGIAYEYSDKSDLTSLIESAINQDGFETRRRSMQGYLTGILSDFLYGYSNEVPTKKHLPDLARFVSLNGAENHSKASIQERISTLNIQLKELERKGHNKARENPHSAPETCLDDRKAQSNGPGVKSNAAKPELTLIESTLPELEQFFSFLVQETASQTIFMKAGILCFRLGLYDNARNNFKKILSSDPENIDALNHLGAVSFQLKEYNVAYDLFKKSVDMNPCNEETRQNFRALQQKMQEEWDERAAEDAHYYIHSSRRNQTEDEFDASGRSNVQSLIVNNLHSISGTKDPASMAVLEVGCGIGRMTKYMAKIFGEVHGVDVSGEMIRRGKERLRCCSNIFLHKGNGKDLSMFSDMMFDFVFSFIVFQHIPFKEVILNYLREAYRVLKPEGIFKFQVHGEASRNYLKSPKNTWHGEPVTEDDIRCISKELGFELLSMSGQGTQYSWYTLKKTPSRMIIEENCSLIRSDAKVVKILDEIMQEFELQSAKGGIAN